MALRDGSTVRVRPVRADDRPAIADFFAGLTDRSRTFRFFSAASDLAAAAEAAADVDYEARYGLIATRGGEGRLVGHSGYVGTAGDRAEIAFAVTDELQGRGLATILLAHLAEVAAERGIATFEAEVLPENHSMIEVFRESGLPVDVHSSPGAIHVELPTSFTTEARERFEDRDRTAATAAVRRFLEPRSAAVIGASRERATVGGQLFHNLIEAGFEGVASPVNPAAEVVQSVRAYASVAEVPSPVDLAVVAVPAAAVIDVARECAAAGVAAIVVVSAGFAETGEEGAARQRELAAVCREAGMRLVGPNCLGVINASAGVRLNATFAPGMPPAGNVGFISQSGALGLALIELARERRLGLSSFASIGNRADITGNDLLEYWGSEPGTDVALLYIESFSDPRRFSRVSRRIGRTKPIVVVKSGRSPAGARATSSHTGAMIAASDVTVDALFEQAGVIRTDSLAEMLDVASLLARQPLPEGHRVAVLTNAGGPGAMCADACEASGLELPALDQSVVRRLREFLPPEASLGNPVDMIATATAEDYRRAIAAITAWDGIDALIVIFVRPLLIKAEDVADAVARAVEELPREIPVQAVFMAPRDRAAMIREGGVPTYLFPEEGAHALARVAKHADWKRRPSEDPPTFSDVSPDAAAAVIAEALGNGEGWLGPASVTRLLGAYGLPSVESRVAAGPEQAERATEEIGGPVALKAAGPEIVHKSDLGAVALDLRGGDEVAEAAARIDERLRRAGVAREQFLVQAMAEPGVEMLIGVVGDALFGPVIACGAGGVEAELINDVSVRLSPLTRFDAAEMLRSLATFPLLNGYRGAPDVDLESLEDLLLRTSAIVEAHREVAELDLNPVIAGPSGSLVVDARIRVEAAPPPRPWPSAWSQP